MKKTFVVLAFLLCLLTPLSVSALEDERKQKLTQYLERSMETYRIPGSSLVIIQNGEIFYSGQWGEMSNGKEVTTDTPFLIGSLSKPITSLAIMMLVEDGLVKLDEPIQTYLPAFTYYTHSSKNLTVMHLLQQTSGIGAHDGFKVTDNNTIDGDAIAKAVEQLSGVELVSEPGKHYEYVSANYLLLGSIIENVTNQSYAEFVNKRIFTPLGMNQSAADYETAVEKGYVPGFESWFGRPVKSDGFYDQGGTPYGYITSSANDLANFLTFMLIGGDLLFEESLQQLRTLPSEGRTYGFGWHFSKTEHFPFHGGGTSDYRTEMFFIPEQNVAAVLLTNKYHITEDPHVAYIMQGIRAIMNGGEPDRLPAMNLSIQWWTLVVTILIGVLTLVHFSVRRRKPARSNKWSFVFGAFCLFLAISLIPLLAYSMGAPWKTIQLFAPDLAFLVKCLVGMFVINGLISYIPSRLKKS
ncbi:beta-lactamase family protein [Mesobacillus maritimus]|uniref:beta-lactamase family protein n=1 Tax=Mesobacillus maritimus TaxID=1643336 RepID=UPI00203B41D1|nr:beta-lactamase family protein [Mesobacillus maritimus]MCM3585797.1 beta-lactamase family protein [Mesobacillus maritimus]MCM3670557.1 beta-lactamase family protein [Mesobacillus maritimus]